jgi:phosphatidylglycerophosphatase A
LTAKLGINRWSNRVAVAVATGFGIGLIPFAPGTWGSLLGLLAGAALHRDNLSLVIGPSPLSLTIAIQLSAFIGLTMLGIWSVNRTETNWGEHDSGKIVWDEVLGQLIPILVVPLNLTNLVIGFVLFRIFDIWKPGPIGWADRNLPRAWGTLCDDLIAGLVVAVLVYAIQALPLT